MVFFIGKEQDSSRVEELELKVRELEAKLAQQQEHMVLPQRPGLGPGPIGNYRATAGPPQGNRHGNIISLYGPI